VIDPDAIDAVVFDIGGVFTLRCPDLFGGALRSAGLDVTANHARYHRAHYEAIRALSSAPFTAEADPTFWDFYESTYLRALGVADEELDAGRAAVKSLWETGPKPLWRWVIDANVEGFQRIATRWPVAIVSNNDGTAERQLVEFGICQVGPGPFVDVAAVVDSGVIGIAKPDPAVFAPALAALGMEPARVLYVGDTVHADVIGARAAGMPVVQLDPYDLHADHDHDRLPDVPALASQLGV
jgi:putative hydrolase of the HAD superfamily